MDDLMYMQRALELAEIAFENDDIPIGAVVVRNNQIIGEGYNMREASGRAIAHAEIIAIENAAKTLSNWNLSDCTLYVTVEPCLMCSGAIMQSRVSNVVFGTTEPKSGAMGSIIDVSAIVGPTHKPTIKRGILEEESRNLIVNYFKQKRKNKIKYKTLLSQDRIEEYLELRRSVFIDEQGIDESLEFDHIDKDKTSTYVAAYDGEELVGGARYFRKDGDEYSIGRLCVKKSHRRRGIASGLILNVIKVAKSQNIKKITLNAQCNVVSLYQKIGFVTVGNPFKEAGIDHIRLIYIIHKN